MGYLRYGSNTSENAIKYIEKYFSKADIKYKHIGKLLYEMWRHGTVHEFAPKALKHSRYKYIIAWQTNNESKKENRECHLECFKVQGYQDIYLLNINLFELVDNLIFSIKELTSELKMNSILAKEVQITFNKLLIPIRIKDLPKKGKRIKRNLNLQMTRAIKSQKREVNKGQVI